MYRLLKHKLPFEKFAPFRKEKNFYFLTNWGIPDMEFRMVSSPQDSKHFFLTVSHKLSLILPLVLFSVLVLLIYTTT